MFPDGLVAGDGRLQPGDQLIEINGVDMTCATHSQVNHTAIFRPVCIVVSVGNPLIKNVSSSSSHKKNSETLKL